MNTEHLAIKARDPKFNKTILKHIQSLGYSISNPDQKKGDYIDVIREGKITGFDMIAYDSLRNAWKTLVSQDVEELKQEITKFIHESS